MYLCDGSAISNLTATPPAARKSTKVEEEAVDVTAHTSSAQARISISMPLVDVTRGEDKPVHIDEHHDDDDHDHVSPALQASDSVTCLLPPFVLVLHAILVLIVC